MERRNGYRCGAWDRSYPRSLSYDAFPSREGCPCSRSGLSRRSSPRALCVSIPGEHAGVPGVPGRPGPHGWQWRGAEPPQRLHSRALAVLEGPTAIHGRRNQGVDTRRRKGVCASRMGAREESSLLSHLDHKHGRNVCHISHTSSTVSFLLWALMRSLVLSNLRFAQSWVREKVGCSAGCREWLQREGRSMRRRDGVHASDRRIVMTIDS